MAKPGLPRNRIALGALILALALACAHLFAKAPFAIQAEGAARDVRVSLLTPARAMDADIAIVAIGPRTLDRFEFRSPVDRAFLARLIEKIDAAGPRAIGLDILLDQPTRAGDDAALLRAMRATRTHLVLARGDAPTAFSRSIAAGFSSGSVMLLADGADGVVRRSAIDANGPTFAEALAGKRARRREPAPIGFARASAGGVPFVQIPAEYVVDATAPLPLFAGRVVLVGGVMDDSDQHATPLRFAPGSASLPGVVIHAFQLRQLMDEARGPRGSPLWDSATAVAAALAALLIAWSGAPILIRLALALLAILGAGLGVFIAFQAFELMLNLSLVAAAFLASAFLAFGFEEQRRRDQARRIRSAFDSFLAPQVVRELAADPARVQAHADMREIAIVFTDLTGFAALVERAAPRDVQRMLNAYLDLLAGTIVAHGGMVDKFVGDGVHAFFGAPLPQADSAARAARCALDLEEKAEAFRREYSQLDIGATRIGAHFGRALVGNFGGVRRLDYTAHGSAVNLTARLEQANKMLGTSVCASAALAEASAAPLLWRPAGQIRVRGLDQTVDIHTSLATGHSRADFLRAYDLIATNPARALAAFEALERAQTSVDPLLAHFRNRLAAGLGSEPLVVA